MLAAATAMAFAIGACTNGGAPAEAAGSVVPLKEAKLIIEHNATANDTGFQGFVDSEGWETMELRGPGGRVLQFDAKKTSLGKLGLTELFFETVEPENVDVSIAQMLAKLPQGRYTYTGKGMENGESTGRLAGSLQFSHTIPAGPKLLAPAEGSKIPITGQVASWGAVTTTISGGSVTIIAYQLIIQKDSPPHAAMIGKFGLSIYLPPTVTSIAIPDGFLEAGTAYDWEVLAIEQGGNQTLSSGKFTTR